MRVTVFGASGVTGRHLIDQALTHGHHVTAFVRDASRFDAKSERLTVVVDDVAEAAIVASVVEQRGVRRLVYLSFLGVPEGRHQLSLVGKYVVAPLLLRHVVADHAAKERIIQSSSLEWVIVRPPRLTNGARRGIYEVAWTFRRPQSFRISRADMADFIGVQGIVQRWRAFQHEQRILIRRARNHHAQSLIRSPSPATPRNVRSNEPKHPLDVGSAITKLRWDLMPISRRWRANAERTRCWTLSSYSRLRPRPRVRPSQLHHAVRGACKTAPSERFFFPRLAFSLSIHDRWCFAHVKVFVKLAKHQLDPRAAGFTLGGPESSGRFAAGGAGRRASPWPRPSRL
jgi:NAD(P)H-binding